MRCVAASIRSAMLHGFDLPVCHVKPCTYCSKELTLPGYRNLPMSVLLPLLLPPTK